VRVVAVDRNGDACLSVWNRRSGSVLCSWTGALRQPSSGCEALDCDLSHARSARPIPRSPRERSSQTALQSARARGATGIRTTPTRDLPDAQLDEHQLHEFHLDQLALELELDEHELDDDDECAVQAWVGLRGYESLSVRTARTDKQAPRPQQALMAVQPPQPLARTVLLRALQDS